MFEGADAIMLSAETAIGAHPILAARTAARIAEVAAIACFSRTGRTATLMSTVRPHVPIFAFSPDDSALRRLALRRAVTTIHAEEPGDTDAMIAIMDRELRARGHVPEGGLVLMSASIPAGAPYTNFLKVQRLGT